MPLKQKCYLNIFDEKDLFSKLKTYFSHIYSSICQYVEYLNRLILSIKLKVEVEADKSRVA